MRLLQDLALCVRLKRARAAMCAENLNLIVCSIKERMEHIFLGAFLVKNQSDKDTKIREVSNE